MANSEKADQDTGDAAVGYRRPPVSTRFQKGQSGNPNGRPRGTLNVATALSKAMREKVIINENGKRKVVSKLEASSKQIVNQAASGKIQAARYLFDLALQIEKNDNQLPNPDGAISEVDHEVIQGLLNRFQPQQPESEPQPEVKNDDDQRR